MASGTFSTPLLEAVGGREQLERPASVSGAQEAAGPFEMNEYVRVVRAVVETSYVGKRGRIVFSYPGGMYGMYLVQFVDDASVSGGIDEENLERLTGEELTAAAKEEKKLALSRKRATCRFKLNIIGRFFLLGILTCGPLELYLHMMVVDHPEIANKHNFMDSTGHTDFYPVPGCKLPPSQPLGIQALANAAKLTLGMLILGTMPDHPEGAMEWEQNVPQWSRWLYVGMTTYQLVLVPVTVALTLWHFIMDSGPFESHWDSYNCYAATIVSGPWWFNVLMFSMKAFMGVSVLYEHGIFQGQKGLISDLALRETFTGDCTVRQIQIQKSNASMYLSWLTVAPYTLMMLPVLITHLVPALIIFTPVVLVLGSMAMLLFWFTAVNEHGEHIMKSFLQPVGTFVGGRAWATAERCGGLMTLPLLIGANIIIEVLVYQAIYLYHGDGWEHSMLEAFMERQTTIYFTNFKMKVLNAWWTSMDLLNQST